MCGGLAAKPAPTEHGSIQGTNVNLSALLSGEIGNLLFHCTHPTLKNDWAFVTASGTLVSENESDIPVENNVH
jgi:hypothetical protein